MNFRNLEPLEWRPGVGVHLLLGPNGAGKTSLLEAIYLLATTRSFRTAQLGDCCRHGAPGFVVRGEARGASRVSLEVAWEAGARERKVNGRRASLTEHLAVLPVVSWCGADRELLTGGPASRRRLLDQGIVGIRPTAVAVLARYRRALRHKRHLLARGLSGLEAWNRVLAPAAAEIIRLRAAYAEELQGAVVEELARTGVGLPRLELRYHPSPPRGREGEEAMLSELARLRRREQRRQRPEIGPHRDELEIRLGGREARRVASAGEQKALGLLLFAARRSVLARRGREPVLLVDDADAELDSERLVDLWRSLAGSAQLFASSSRPAAWEGFTGVVRWRLGEGRLAAARGAPRAAG